MSNVFSHSYQLDESISNFRVVGGIFQFYSNFNRNSCKHFAACDLIFALFADVLGLYGLT